MKVVLFFDVKHVTLQDMAIMQAVAPKHFAFVHPLFHKGSDNMWDGWQRDLLSTVAQMEMLLANHMSRTPCDAFINDDVYLRYKTDSRRAAMLDQENSHPYYAKLRDIVEVRFTCSCSLIFYCITILI